MAGQGFNPFQGFGGVSAGLCALFPQTPISGFNPFQGFGGVSARGVPCPRGSAKPPGFNPFQGFGGVSATRLAARQPVVS